MKTSAFGGIVLSLYSGRRICLTHDTAYLTYLWDIQNETSYVWFGLRYSGLLGALISEKWLFASSCLCVHPSFCPHGTTRHPLDGFSWNLIFKCFFFEKLSRKFKFHQNRTRISGTLHQTTRHFSSYLALFFWLWEMFQTNVVEEIKTHILCSRNYFFSNRAIYEIMWKNTVERGRPQMTIWRMRIACRISKATNTHSQ